MCFIPSVGNISATLPSSTQQFFVALTSSSNAIYSISSAYTSFNGSPISGQSVVSIPYTFESRDTIPRSVITAFQMNASDTLTITPGDDGAYGSGTSITPTGNLQRSIVPLNFIDSTMSKQIKITTSTSNAYSINPLILDTEIGH
jgi:hypothetical protein